MKGYGGDISLLDSSAMYISGVFGQLIVVMFLFFSGYGVSESIKRRGIEYVKGMPRHRIFKTLMNFDVAVILFFLVNIALGHPLPFKRLVLSLIAWDSVGNSNWYVFSILVCYLLTFVVALCYRSIGWYMLVVVLATIWAMSFFKAAYWYNTMMAYPVGILVSENRDIIDKMLKRHFASVMTMSAGLFLFLYLTLRGDLNGIGYNFLSISFAFLVIVLMYKVHVENYALQWAGRNLFPLYIYQRLSFMLLSTLFPREFLVSGGACVFSLLALISTIAIAFVYARVSFK